MTLEKFCSATRKALDDFSMLSEGDAVAVGVSGGKDSLALVTALQKISRYHPARFSVRAITVDLGFPGADFTPVARYLETLGVPYTVKKTEIGPIVFDERKEQNPCALCSKMKRGVLCETAKELGCTRLALAHHKDDLIDTFLLNLFYAGRIDTFLPVTDLSRTGITVIRPLIYLEEKEVVYFANKNPMPVCSSLCPADRHTCRQDMKELLRSLSRENPDLKAKIFGAIERAGLLDRKENETVTHERENVNKL